MQVTAIAAGGTLQLLNGISRLPMLESLELYNCISVASSGAETKL